MGKRHKPHIKKTPRAVKVSKPKKVQDDPDVDMNDPKNIYDDVEAFHNDDTELEIGLDSVLYKKKKKVEDVLAIGGYSSSSDSSEDDQLDVEEENSRRRDTVCGDDTESSTVSKQKKYIEMNMGDVKKSQKKMKNSVYRSVLNPDNKNNCEDADSSDDDVDLFGENSDYYKSISKQIKVMNKERIKLKSFLEEAKVYEEISPDVKEYLDIKFLILTSYLAKMHFYTYLLQSKKKAEGHPILRDIAKIKYHLEDLEEMRIHLPEVEEIYS